MIIRFDLRVNCSCTKLRKSDLMHERHERTNFSKELICIPISNENKLIQVFGEMMKKAVDFARSEGSIGLKKNILDNYNSNSRNLVSKYKHVVKVAEGLGREQLRDDMLNGVNRLPYLDRYINIYNISSLNEAYSVDLRVSSKEHDLTALLRW